jgi:hypothetical protein
MQYFNWFSIIFFFAVLYNAENCPIWKIYSVPCDSALDKFYCIYIYVYKECNLTTATVQPWGKGPHFLRRTTNMSSRTWILKATIRKFTHYTQNKREFLRWHTRHQKEVHWQDWNYHLPPSQNSESNRIEAQELATSSIRRHRTWRHKTSRKQMQYVTGRLRPLNRAYRTHHIKRKIFFLNSFISNQNYSDSIS